MTRQTITAVIVLGAIYLLNDYRGVPTPVLILTALMLAGVFMATRTALVAGSTLLAAILMRRACLELM